MQETQILDQESIKTANRNRILDLLHREKVLTKQEIAAQTGMSFPTVSSNISYLLKHGFVEEAGVGNSTGGRKPVLTRFLPDARFSFGVNIEPGGIRIIRTNLDMRILDDSMLPISRADTQKEIIRRIADAISSIIIHKGLSHSRILGIGVSVSGIVNNKSLTLEVSPGLGISGMQFKELKDLLHLPVYLENEANAAALAELKLGIAKGMRNLIYVSITHGVGSGIVMEGKLYTGAHNRAGELGHQIIIPGGRQ